MRAKLNECQNIFAWNIFLLARWAQVQLCKDTSWRWRGSPDLRTVCRSSPVSPRMTSHLCWKRTRTWLSVWEELSSLTRERKGEIKWWAPWDTVRSIFNCFVFCTDKSWILELDSTLSQSWKEFWNCGWWWVLVAEQNRLTPSPQTLDFGLGLLTWTWIVTILFRGQRDDWQCVLWHDELQLYESYWVQWFQHSTGQYNMRLYFIKVQCFRIQPTGQLRTTTPSSRLKWLKLYALKI